MDYFENRERLRDMLVQHEGLRLSPYRCTAGRLTIGVGRNLDDRGITKEEAMAMLENDIDECKRDLEEFPWFKTLDTPRRCALIDLRFNLGGAGFRRFRKAIAALERHDYATAADEMLASKWARQTGPRALRLSSMIRNGRWPDV